jgi:hypothetical protein
MPAAATDPFAQTAAFDPFSQPATADPFQHQSSFSSSINEEDDPFAANDPFTAVDHTLMILSIFFVGKA